MIPIRRLQPINSRRKNVCSQTKLPSDFRSKSIFHFIKLIGSYCYHFCRNNCSWKEDECAMRALTIGNYKLRLTNWSYSFFFIGDFVAYRWDWWMFPSWMCLHRSFCSLTKFAQAKLSFLLMPIRLFLCGLYRYARLVVTITQANGTGIRPLI